MPILIVGSVFGSGGFQFRLYSSKMIILGKAKLDAVTNYYGPDHTNTHRAGEVVFLKGKPVLLEQYQQVATAAVIFVLYMLIVALFNIGLYVIVGIECSRLTC